jgi:hypothetical protein
MTAPTVKEYVLSAGLFEAPPTPGAYFRSPSGNSALLVNRVRSVHEGAAGPRYRLFVTRTRLCDLAPGIELRPWPAKRIRTASTAAEPPAPTDRPIVTRAKKATLERQRVIALSREARLEGAVVGHQIKTGAAVPHTRRDPEDLNGVTTRFVRNRTLSQKPNDIRSFQIRSFMNDSGPARQILGFSLSKPSFRIALKGNGHLHGPLAYDLVQIVWWPLLGRSPARSTCRQALD